MKRRTSLIVTVIALLVIAAGALQAQTGSPVVSWFSTRMILKGAHPLRQAPTGAIVPGPVVVSYIWDDWNRATCVMVISNHATGQVVAVSVPAGSCAAADEP